MIEKEIKIKDLNIQYKVFERKTSLPADRRVLILHGWGSRSDNWQRAGEMLAEKGIKVIIPDLPGFGQSDKPQMAWGLDDYCDFVEEFLNKLGLSNKLYLLGHSFGGALALKLSLRAPERIDELFLVGAACFRRKTFKNNLFKFLSKFLKIKTPFLRKVFYRKSDYLSTQGVMRDTYLKVIAEDLSNLLSQIQIPTVIVWGEKDNITPLNDAKIINRKIKDSKLEIISNVGHDINIKAPDELAEIVIKFL